METKQLIAEIKAASINSLNALQNNPDINAAINLEIKAINNATDYETLKGYLDHFISNRTFEALADRVDELYPCETSYDMDGINEVIEVSENFEVFKHNIIDVLETLVSLHRLKA